MKTDLTEEGLERQAQQAIGDICRRLDEAVKPTLIQILLESKSKQVPAITTLFGIVAFAASETALGIQIMARCGADQGKLIEFCAENFKQWMLDCIEQNIAGSPN